MKKTNVDFLTVENPGKVDFSEKFAGGFKKMDMSNLPE